MDQDDIQRQKAYMKVARDRMDSEKEIKRFYANEHREHGGFYLGEFVMVKSEGVSANDREEFPQKWTPKFMSLLKILYKELVKFSYKIEIPHYMKRAHNVVHV